MSAVTYATAQILRVLPRQRIGQAIGKLADSPWPAPVGRAIVGLYSRLYDIELDEYVDERSRPRVDDLLDSRIFSSLIGYNKVGIRATSGSLSNVERLCR